MRLNEITVENFRNLSGSRIQFREPVTLFYGPNAQGKTNLLEAIYMLGTTRSFRDNRTKVLLREGTIESRLTGEVSGSGASHRLTLEMGSGGRRYQRDETGVPLSEYLRCLPVVVLSVEDRGLVQGIPRHRRDFLDGTAVWRRPGVDLDTLMEFGRAREQRNHILRSYGPRRARELEAWTEAFLHLAQDVQGERNKTTEGVNGALGKLAKAMGIGEDIRVVYAPSGDPDLGRALKECRPEETRRGLSLVGPHRDNVEILLNGRPLSSYGSSGQVRTALWLLKLTRVQLLSDLDATPPLFLLDDVEAELDEERISKMVGLTRGKAQLVMTATRPLDYAWGSLSRFRVEAGKVKEEV